MRADVRARAPCPTRPSVLPSDEGREVLEHPGTDLRVQAPRALSVRAAPCEAGGPGAGVFGHPRAPQRGGRDFLQQQKGRKA